MNLERGEEVRRCDAKRRCHPRAVFNDMRLGEGSKIRVSVPLHVLNAETAPGVKRGGTVNIVTHSIDLEVPADNIPQYLEADVGKLDMEQARMSPARRLDGS